MNWKWSIIRPMPEKLTHNCLIAFYAYGQTAKQSVFFFSKSVKKSVKCGVRVLRTRDARGSHAFLFDCSRVLEYAKIRTVLQSRGAYHLTENFGNSGWKVNGKVTFRKFQPKIEEYVQRQSFHSGWYEPNGMLLTINQFLSSFSVPDSRDTNSPFFGIQTVTDVAFLWYTGKSLTIMLSTTQPDFSVKW